MRNMSFCIIMSLVIITMTISCTSVTPVTESKTTASAKSTAEESRRYPELKSAIIKYNVSGMNNGTETVYIDDWGRREAIYKKFSTKLMGIDIERNFMTLITENGKWVYNIDLNSKTAIKMNNIGFKALQGNSGSNMDVAIGAMKIGTEEILGKVCDVWKKGYPYSMAWMWKGIALKKDQDVAAMGVVTEATEIQENVTIPEDKLIIPSDVKVKVLDARALSGM
ncbi:MAG: hypothetical protein H8D23_06935 [Candidatus Brocadiales bacterium]|nr:hypothetical protein [Candidatus Brocadiales bacterium]